MQIDIVLLVWEVKNTELSSSLPKDIKLRAQISERAALQKHPAISVGSHWSALEFNSSLSV
jgi:hypothetical protein